MRQTPPAAYVQIRAYCAVRIRTISSSTIPASRRCSASISSRAGCIRFKHIRLNALARKPLERSREVAYIHDRLIVAPIQELVGELSINHRTLISKFKEEIGMSPKRLTRLLRFQEVLSSMEDVAANQDLNWADIALACGYYDQAHFIHEFRAFSGMKPTDYQSIPGRHMNHAVIAPDP